MLDFEKEGFRLIGTTSYNETHEKPWLNHPRYWGSQLIHIIYTPQSKWVLITSGDNETHYPDWTTMFAGRIEKQEELEMVLRMVINYK